LFKYVKQLAAILVLGAIIFWSWTAMIDFRRVIENRPSLFEEDMATSRADI